MQRGFFITLEGIDGAGKSSQTSWIQQYLEERSCPVIITREPGGTAMGESLRDLLLQEDMHLETETLLMFAARREHLCRVIEPALAEGKWVVCDRFSDATYAYQGGGRGLSLERIATLEHWVHGHIYPDLTLLFDVPVQVARERIVRSSRNLDRFEQEKVQFHERVRQGYLERARSNPRRVHLIDGTQEVAEIEHHIKAIIDGMLASVEHRPDSSER